MKKRMRRNIERARRMNEAVGRWNLEKMDRFMSRLTIGMVVLIFVLMAVFQK